MKRISFVFILIGLCFAGCELYSGLKTEEIYIYKKDIVEDENESEDQISEENQKEELSDSDEEKKEIEENQESPDVADEQEENLIDETENPISDEDTVEFIEDDSGNDDVEAENPSEFGTKAELLLPEEIPERLWNILVYMAADNNLEASAIEDLCEMEMSNLDTGRVSVFVLLDRNEAYDTSNGDWAGTKLLRLSTGKISENRFIQSEEIECKELGLKPGTEVELDMSSPYVLADTISYLHKRYPAENYGLIMWGHGTGWRNDGLNQQNECSTGGYKGFAFDETSHTYMTLRQFGNALKAGLNGKKFDFVGFDTCFGAELEVMYEIRNYTKYAMGSEGLVMNSGWNYKSFLNSIQKDDGKSALSICLGLSEKFKEWYETTSASSFTVINMENMESYFDCFDKYMACVADLITTRGTRDKVMGVLYSNPGNTAEKYTYGSQSSDVYLDVNSMIRVLDEYFSTSSTLKKASSMFNLVEHSVIVDSWNSIGTRGGLGVFFDTLGNGNILSAIHPSAYVQGKMAEQIDFVQSSSGYVPSVKSKHSLLEKLFYETFE